MSDHAWNILDTGFRSAEENMLLDAELLDGLDPHASPILHFYDWEGDSATYGYFVKPSDFLNLEEAKKRGLQLAKRPTGGGIVFHIWDLAFSVLIPAGHPHFSEKTLDNYAFVNDAVLAAVSAFLEPRPNLETISEFILPTERSALFPNGKSFKHSQTASKFARLSRNLSLGKNLHPSRQKQFRDSLLELIESDAEALDPSCIRFCMAQPTKYDVVLQGKKIAGAAQRKTKKGFLHQGTIALKMPPEAYLKAVLLPETKVLEAIQANTFPLIAPDDGLEIARDQLKKHLETHLTREHANVTES